ncbi:hypothetical protein GCM10022381_18670 [Leifsonia kafniensis]|uniref:Uncharacterized protein n=1 Tax=Leifsonia kafniensis TaxID=475957 RepID=A0ABP7KG03_9MICO
MSTNTQRTVASRVFACALVLVLGGHFVMTFAWNSAPNAIRALIGQNVLTAYMTPVFIQGWAVFAPNPAASNVSLEVRGLLPGVDGGEDTESEWFSITAHDNAAAILHNPVPSRMYLSNYILGDRFHAAFLQLNPDVRELVGGDFYGDGWLDRVKIALLSGMKVDSDVNVTQYVEYEQTVTGLATAIARARWGNEITGVQVKVVTTPVIPFAQRHDPTATTQPAYFIEGWRSPLEVPGLDESVIVSMYGKAVVS